MLARDVILTLGAWLIIAYFFHEGIARAIDYFSPPMFELTRTSPPDWAYRWEKLRGFIAARRGPGPLDRVLGLRQPHAAEGELVASAGTARCSPSTPAGSAFRRKISISGGPRKSRLSTSTPRCTQSAGAEAPAYCSLSTAYRPLPTAYYSYLNARIGSIRLARCAGISPASAETVVRSNSVAIAIVGSYGWIP